MTTDPEHAEQGEHHRAAIARWQLGLQAETKRASSLPSATFGACDPTLEARLAAATGALLQRLLELPDTAQGEAGGDARLEIVRADEFAALLAEAALGRFAGAETPIVRQGDDAEFQAILAEILLQGDGVLPARAAALLGAMHGDSLADLDTLTAAIARAQPIDDELQAVTHAISREVAEAILRHAPVKGSEAS